MADYDSTITVGIKTVLDEQGIQKTESSLADLRDSLSNAFLEQGTDENKNIFESALTSVTALSASVQGLKGIFQDLGGSLTGNITNAMHAVEHSIQAMQKSIVDASKTGFSSDNLNKILTNSLSFSESSGLINRLIANSQKSIGGWSQAAFSEKMPVLMSQIINPEIKKLQETAFVHDRPNLDRYVDALVNNNAVRRGLNYVSGSKMSTDEARTNIERALLLYNQRAVQSFGAEAVAKAPFAKSTATVYPHDVIPEQFRTAYYGRGHSRNEEGPKAEAAFLATLPKQGTNYVSRKTYEALRNYVQTNENGVALHDILKQAGIMSVEGGNRNWAKHLTVAQASLLGGLSAQELYNAKRGYAFYDADPNDSASDARVDHRMSRRVQAQLALMDILSQDKRITPSTNYRLEDLDQAYVVRPGSTAKTRIKGTRITETGTPDQFVMPLTTIDERSGQLVYRDPKWQKKTGLFEEREDDQFAIMTDNPLVQLARQIGYKGKNGNVYGRGNGTFGYGRNDRGEAIYDTPPVIKLNTDQFFETDKSGFNRTLSPEREKQLKSVLSGKQYKYGDRNYEYAYQGDSGVYMIESGLKKQIEDWYEARNLPSFFQGLNEGGLESIPDYGKLIKQINGLKKGSSTSQAYEDVFGTLQGHGAAINRELSDLEKQKGYTRDVSGFVYDENGKQVHDLNTRVANLTAWYNAIYPRMQNESKAAYEERIASLLPDGAAFGNASVFRNGPLQMRSAVGFGKYVLNPFDLTKVFGAATAGFTQDQIDQMGESHGNNWLFSKGQNGQVQVWLPSITADEADVTALQTGKLSDAQQKQYGSLAELRRQKFFVGNDENNDLILTDKTAKQYQAFKYLSEQHYRNQYGDAAFNKAVAEHRFDKDKGLVTLLPSEQGEMHNRATPSYMVMRSAWDFANDPTIMSQQTFAATGKNQEIAERSDEEFARRIYSLRTASGRMKALQANPFYARMLDQNPNFAYSSEASGYIEKQIRELQDKQLAGYIALPQEGENAIKSVNRVAAITPGALIEPILRAAGLSEDNIDAATKALLPSQMDASGLIYTGKGISGKAGDVIQVHRDPNAPGQQIQVSSMFSTEAIRNKMREFGVSDEMADQAIYLTQNQARHLNTGDFDGDTVRAYLGLPQTYLEQSAKIQAAIEEEQKKYNAALEVRDTEENKKQAVSVVQGRLDALTRYFGSTQTMGQASKVIREAMELPDTDSTKWSRIYEGMKLYDFASSEMRTKGLDPVISDYALEMIQGGNSFDRFLMNMRKNNGKEDIDLKKAHLGRDIFKTDLPTFGSPQGIVSSLMRGRSVLAGESDYSDFKASMSKLMDMEYGDSQAPEAKAARWYAEQYGKTAFGRLLTKKDLAQGDDLAYQWLRSMNLRNVGQDADEYRQYNRFSKRLGRLRESDSMTYDNMVERAASLQTQYQRTGNENIKAQWALTEEAIRNHDKYETDYSALEKIQKSEQHNEELRAQNDALEVQKALKREAQVAEEAKETPTDVWNNPNVAANWSNFKNWIKGPIKLSNVKQISSSGVPIDTALTPILFDDLASRINVASSELYGQKDETDHIIIGNAMHSAFEDYWKAVATGTNNGKTVDDYFTALVTGEGEYARKLDNRGYKIRKTSKEGEPERYEAIGPRGTGLDKLNNLLRTNENKGVSSLSDFITALDQAGFDVEHPENIEGNFYTYKDGQYQSVDKSGNYEMKLRIPILDENGKETGQYDETKTTHARPDLMLRNKNDNGLYVVDYKSRYEGAAESLVQSAFYSSVIDTLAKRAWTGVHESEKDENGNLRKLTADEIASYASFKQAGHLEKDAEGKDVYVSDIKGAIGFDPRTRRSVMISREGENAKYFDEGVKLAQDALANKMIDAKGLMQGGSAYMRAIMNEASISRQVDNSIRSHLDNEGHIVENPMEEKERDFFLSRYQADRDAIKGIRSAVYKEKDEPERYYNRFQGYERTLKEALPDNVVAAVMQQYSRDGYVDMQSPVIQELSEEMKEKARLLGQVQELGINAATTDWEKAGADIQKSLGGIGQTKTESTLEAVNRRIKQAESSRDFLKTRMVEVTDDKGNKTSVPVYQKYQQDEKGNYVLRDYSDTIEEQAALFDTENANAEVATRAKTLKEEFLKSVEAQKGVEQLVDKNLDKFLKEDSAKQDQEWSSMIGEIKDPSEVLNQTLSKKTASAQKKIDTWNSEIEAWSKELAKGNVSPTMQKAYLSLITDRSARIANAEKDISGGKVEQAALEEEKKRLGMTTATPQERAQKWLDERLAVLNAETTLKYDQKNEALQKLYEADENEGYATQKAYEEAIRRNNEINKPKELAEKSAPYRLQAQALEEMYTRQESRPYEDFMNKANRSTLTRDERVQRQLDDMQAYAVKQSINKDLSQEARQKWVDLLGNQEFWNSQKEQLNKEDINQEALRDLHQQNAIANIQAQNEVRNANMQRQFANANRQQNMRYGTSKLANAIYAVEQRRDSAQVQYDNINSQIDTEKRTQAELKMRMDNAAPDSKEYKEAANAYAQSEERLKGLTTAAGTAKEQLDQLNGVGSMGKAVFGSLSQSVSMLITRFGRQLFQKALTEAKRFVKEFDATMTSIQMITLKTDDQMSKIGDGLISKAKELKVSISDITKSAETLYRQGLSDEEVNERLDVIAKFSKVSGTKTDAATKLITVAMNTGLASDPQVVADIVTALGDNAATNASEIEKGIEKAGAAAAADGTTFAQLASMLTAITSTTQIGGNVAGRTLNTIFGRMNKIGTSELIVDENGNKISGSAVAKLLKAQGINTYDEQGNKRSSYDVLYDLSRKWETMSDAEQQQIATAIAGTRQYSNFAAIMQGMSEGKVDEYMNLAGNASGITDKKYDIYLKSLQASLTDLKNTFDNLVQDLTKSGIAQKVIKGLTNIIQGVDNLVNSEGGLAKIVDLMIRLSIAMVAIKSGNPYAMLAGAAVAGISLVALHASGEQTSNTKTSEQVLEESRTQASEKYSSSTNEIERARELKAKGSNRTKEEEQEYNSLISKFRGTYSITGKAGSEYTELGDTLSDASKHVEELEAATKNLGSSAKSASEGLSDYEESLINYYETKRNSDKIEAEYGDAPAAGETAAKKYASLGASGSEKISGIEAVEKYNGVLWDYNKETGEIKLNKNWYTNLAKIRENDIHGNMSVEGEFMTDILPGAIEGRYVTGQYGAGFDYTHYDYDRRGAEGLIDLFGDFSQYKKDYAEGKADDWKFGDDYAVYHTTQADEEHMQAFMNQLMLYVLQRYSEYKPEENQESAYQTQAMEEMIADILPEDMAVLSPFIAKALAERYPLEEGLDPNKVFQDAYVYAEGGEENRLAKSDKAKRKRLLELAEEGGYNAEVAERERQLKELGVVEGQEGDYYIDESKRPGEEGYIRNYDEVVAENEKYKTLIGRQAWTYTTTGKKSGAFYEVKAGTEFESEAKGDEYKEKEKSSWYFKDNEGKVTYTEGPEKAAELQTQYHQAGESEVTVSYYNPNTGETITYTGKEKDVKPMIQQQHAEDKSKAFEVRVSGTDQRYAGSKVYGSKAQAEQEAAIANAAEAEAYQKRVAEAEATRHAEIVSLYGQEAGDLIYQQINGQAPEGMYVALGANRQFIKSFDSEEAAAIYQHENTEYINNATGESFGFGEEGRLAAQQAKDNGEFLEYYIDGQYLGRGAEGLKRANEIRENGGIYKYTNDEGETEYTLDKAEYEEAIQRKYEEKLQKAMYDNAGYFSGEGYGNQSGIGYIGEDSWQSWSTPYIIEEYTDEKGRIRYRASHNNNVQYEEGDLDDQGRIKSLVLEANQEYGPHGFVAPVKVSSDEIYTDNFEGISTQSPVERIEALKFYVDSLVGAIPDLKDVDPQVVLEVWGQLPEEIQETIITTGEVGEEALETVKSASDAVLAAKPKFKAIKNHFMAGASTAYGQWQTENNYATTSDAMLRMIQDHPEINDLQSLLTYVNENDISEWSTLNTNKDFARLVAPLQLDHGIIQNSQEQQDEIYDQIIRLLYKNGRDYGERQFSVSQKAGYAQSGYNKLFANDIWNQEYNQASAAEVQRLTALGMDQRSREFGSAMTRFNQEYRAAHPQITYFDSQQAAEEEAEKRAAADLKVWQDARDAAYNEEFYRKELTSKEKEEGYSINQSGYVVDKEGKLTGARIDGKGFLVDAEGNKSYKEQYITNEKLNQEAIDFASDQWEQSYKRSNPYVDISARQNEYLKGYQWINEDERKYLEEAVGTPLYQRLWGSEGGATDVEKAYASMLISNRANGITELTAQQKADLSSGVYADIKAGKALNYEKMDDTTRASFMSGISGTSDLYQMALLLEEAGLSFQDAISGNISDEDLNKAFKGRYTANDLRATNLSVSQADRLNGYRNAANYQQISSTYAGLTSQRESEQLSTYQSIDENQRKLSRGRFALDQLDTSKTFEELDEALIDELSSVTGYSKEAIKSMWKADASSAKSKLESAISAQSSELNDTLIATYDILADGADISSLGENVDTETLASYFDETNKALATYIRTVGLVVKDGKLQVKAGTESLYTSLAEAQSAVDAANKTKAGAMALAKTVAFGTTEGEYSGLSLQKRAEKLVQNNSQDLSAIDENLRYMLNLAAQEGSDITEADLQQAYSNALFGGGSTANKYNYAGRKLFGENGFAGITSDTLASIKNTYQQEIEANSEESPLVKMWQAMFSDMGEAGSAIQDYLNGSELPDNFDQIYAEWLASEAFKGNRNAAENATNVGLLATGRASDRATVLGGYFGQMANANKAQLAMASPLDLTKQEDIVSFLGLDKDYVATQMQSESGQALIQSLIDEKRGDILSNMKNVITQDLKGMDIDKDVKGIQELDLSGATDFDSLITTLRSAADHAEGETKDKLTALADALEGAADAASQDFSQAFKQAQQRLKESTYEYKGSKYIQEAAANYNPATDGNFWEYIKNKEGKNEGDWNNDWNGAIMNNNGIVAAMSLLSSGGMTYPQFNQFMSDQMSGAGKNHDYYDLIAQASLGNNYQNGQFVGPGLDKALGAMKVDENLRGFYDELISRFPELEDAAKGSTTALNKLNSNWKADKAADVAKYAKGVEGLSDIMTDLAKDGTDATKAEMKLNAEMEGLRDQQLAINKARGKSGKQLQKAKDKGDQTLDILAGLLPFDADQLANMSQEKLDELLNQVQPMIGEQFADTVQSLWSMLPEQYIGLPIGQLITVGVDGQLELTEFASQLGAEQQRILNIIMSLLGTYATVDVRAMLNDGSITVEALLAGLKKSGVNTGGGGYSRKNKKTGGSGKTKTDALIEGQGHYIKLREHDVKMAQERETRYEKTNNYQGYLDALNSEIEAQMRLRQQYEANITALKEQLGTLQTGTEEWYKCKEAILAAEEAMAQIDNEIDSINSKKINIVETKHANMDKPISHASTMLDLKAQNYLEKGQFENYEAVTKAKIANYQNDIAMNMYQIDEWEKLLATYEEGTADWITVRDKIWALKEENAELENKALQETHALQNAKISQIATDLQNMLSPFEHEQNMLGTWAGIYDKGHQYGAYRGALESQNEYSKGQAQLYQASIDELRKQMSTLEVGSEAWLNARSAIFEYQEALAQVTASIQENDAAIEESYVNELTTQYQDAEKSVSHEMNMAKITAEGYKAEGDYENYRNMLDVEKELAAENLNVKKTGLAAMEELLNSGKLKEGSDQWKALREQIMGLREEVAQGENDYAALTRQIRETDFTHAVEEYQKQDNITQHEIRMVQYEETKYQNNGQLTNYGHALEWDNATQKKRAEAMKEQIALLEEQREAAKDDPELYNKIDAEIMKMEENLASTNNTIEKNNKLIEQNQENIKKLAKGIEDTLDKEIKARDKQQRDMLAGEVAVQNSILDVIKKAKQDEWNLEKKTREEHKKTLQNEKNLINERLQARKAAIDAEDKYELLAEYQKQLALIAMDPTRSKDAKELRRQIADLQKEISWDITEEEAQASMDALDDMIQAEDDYIKVHEEDLKELLENSGNFMDEVKDVMGESYDDYAQYLDWMKENNEDYKNASAETQKQMEQNWKDTWDKMYGHTDTYWDEIMGLMSNKEEFLDFMKESQEYLNASDSGKWILEHQWSTAYDNYAASLIDDAEFADNHEILDKISEMKDWTYKVEPVVDYDYDYGSYATGLQYWWARKKDDTTGVAQDAIDQAYDKYSSIIGSDASLYESQRDKGETQVPEIIIEIDGGGNGYSGGTKKPTSKTPTPTETKKYYEVYDEKGIRTNYVVYATDKTKANQIAKKQIGSYYSSGGSGYTSKPSWAKKTYYKHGGLIDFTGPAWVDGSKQRPESILSAYDTESIRQLANALSFVRVTPGISPSSDYFNSTTSNIGDINITINQAELKEDADFDDVARRVGKAFTKQLNKEGFNLARYSF